MSRNGVLRYVLFRSVFLFREQTLTTKLKDSVQQISLFAYFWGFFRNLLIWTCGRLHGHESSGAPCLVDIWAILGLAYISCPGIGQGTYYTHFPSLKNFQIACQQKWSVPNQVIVLSSIFL